MSRPVPAGLLLALCSLLIAASSHANELFDGLGAAKLQFPKFQAAPPAPAPAVLPQEPPQSGADLYYFTPQQAEEGRKRFPFRPKAKGFTFDKGVPADIQAQMREDLAFMKSISGSGATPLHLQIYGKVDGGAYSSFFETRVSAIGMNSCGGGNAVACVIPFMDPSKMWLTKNFIRFKHPQVSRMMVVYHEARHTESKNGNFPHADCPTPFKDAQGNDMKSIWTGALLAGEPACDVTPFGSYGSSTIMLKNIQKYCSSCNDKVKMDAGLYADDQINRVTDAGAHKQMEEDFKK